MEACALIDAEMNIKHRALLALTATTPVRKDSRLCFCGPVQI